MSWRLPCSLGATDALELSQEPEYIQRLYGLALEGSFC